MRRSRRHLPNLTEMRVYHTLFYETDWYWNSFSTKIRADGSVFKIQEVSSITEQAEHAVNAVTRRVEDIVKKFNAESLVPRVIWVLAVVVLVEFLYLMYF